MREYFIDDKTMRTIAHRRGVTRHAIGKRVHRLLRILRGRWKHRKRDLLDGIARHPAHVHHAHRQSPASHPNTGANDPDPALIARSASLGHPGDPGHPTKGTSPASQTRAVRETTPKTDS